MRHRFKIVIATYIGLALWCSTTLADGWPPASSFRSVWGLYRNGWYTMNIHIVGDGLCPTLTGGIYGDNKGTNISGFYCPGSGRIVFIRKDNNNRPFEYYSGNLSQRDPSDPLKDRMAGTITNLKSEGVVGDHIAFSAVITNL